MRKKIQISELLYPRRCPICDGLLAGDERYVCRSCSHALRFVRQPSCMKCGRPLDTSFKELCKECRRRPHLFESSLAPFLYREGMQTSMMRFKYGGRAEYAGFYAQAITGFAGELIRGWNPSCIIPVPIHASRERMRGYNQAAVLARELERRLQIPAAEFAVIRSKKTTAQKGLTGSERRKNLSKAFAVIHPEQITDSVLLVDDIYTTGSTLDALTEAVLQLRPHAQVHCVCVCISPGES